MIVCRDCKVSLDLTTNWSNHQRKVCDDCRRAYQSRYRATNAAKLKAAKAADYKANGKARREANLEKVREQSRRHAQEARRRDPEKKRAINKASYERNKDKALAKAKLYREANHGAIIARNAARKKHVRKATPQWADTELIRSLYEAVYWLNKGSEMFDLNVTFHLDHEVPLRGKDVSGLHTEANLRIIEATANMSKGNRWSQPELRLDLDQ